MKPRDFFSDLVHVNWLRFFALNLFRKKTIHSEGGKIIPLWRSCIRIDKKAHVYLGKRNCRIGTFVRPHQTVYAYLFCGPDCEVHFEEGFTLQRGSRIEIAPKAHFNCGFFSTNENVLIRCAKEITIGNHVLISHGTTIFDVDGHTILKEGSLINPPRAVHIGDNVWINRNVSIGKGVTIGEGSVIASDAVITKDVPAHCVAGSLFEPKIIKTDIDWRE